MGDGRREGWGRKGVEKVRNKVKVLIHTASVGEGVRSTPLERRGKALASF